MIPNEKFNELASKSKLAVTIPSNTERRRLREVFQVTQQELAEALNVSRRTIHAWETGTSEPSGENRERYAEMLALWQAREQETANQETANQENRRAS